MHTAPKILYKYRSLSREGKCYKRTRDIFLKDELYFPHPDQINDPFDCKVPPTFFENISKKEILSCLNNKLPRFAPDLDLETIEMLKNVVRSGDVKIICQEIKNKFKEGKYRNVGVLSFSEKNLDIRMWSHYSDSHQGICIGFDCTKMYFHFNGANLSGKKVRYPRDNGYPRWNHFTGDYSANNDKIYFTKSLDWKYEQEWRIILPEKGRTSQKFIPDALVSVHLGCQILEEHRKDVINWCLRREHKPKIYETKKDESSYTLKENEIIY